VDKQFEEKEGGIRYVSKEKERGRRSDYAYRYLEQVVDAHS
jgi:hypothetical protein